MPKVLVFIVLNALTSGAFSNSVSRKLSDNRLYGVDNYQLPNDSLVLMNHLLIDIQLDYEFSIQENNVEATATALHQKALVYLKLNNLELASNYAWRLSNLSDKYGFKNQKLSAYALLTRINETSGNQVKSSFFKKQYQLQLLKVDSNTLKSIVVLGVLPSEILTEKKIVEEAKPIKVSKEPSKLVEESTAGFNWFQNYYLLFVILGALLLMGGWVKQRKYPQLAIVQIKESKVPNIKKTIVLEPKARKSVKVLKKNPNKVTNLQTPTNPKQKENSHETINNNNMTEIGGNSELGKKQSHKTESKVLTAELIKARRGADFYQKSQIQQTPLWVAGIEHHLKGMNTFNGIRFDFNFNGDFSPVEENVQKVVSNFMTSIAETLVDACNVQSVSSQLVNSSDGLVAMVVARPMISSKPVLDVITISSIRKIFMSSTQFSISTHNVPGGLLRIVLKRTVKQFEYAS